MSEYADCRTCKTDCARADGNYGYTFCDKYTHPPTTNADRIRAMSDEELAEFLIDLADDGNLRIRDWLQQPSEEDGHDERKENEHV